MAKKLSSITDIKGTFQGMTHVDSKAYGKHVRSPRGTYKPAVLNVAMKQSSKDLANANVPAQLIRSALAPYLNDFGDGKLWSRLVGVFRKAVQLWPTVDFSVLRGMDLHTATSLDRHFPMQLVWEENAARREVIATLSSTASPNLGKYRLNGYRVSLIAIFPSLSRLEAPVSEWEFPLVKSGETMPETSAPFAIPEDSSVVVFCIKAVGCKDGEPTGILRMKGMKIVAVGPLTAKVKKKVTRKKAVKKRASGIRQKK